LRLAKRIESCDWVAVGATVYPQPFAEQAGSISTLPRELQFPSASLWQLFSALGTVDLSCEMVASLISAEWI
jgi:hypothetical protein